MKVKLKRRGVRDDRPQAERMIWYTRCGEFRLVRSTQPGYGTRYRVEHHVINYDTGHWQWTLVKWGKRKIIRWKKRLDAERVLQAYAAEVHRNYKIMRDRSGRQEATGAAATA